MGGAPPKKTKRKEALFSTERGELARENESRFVHVGITLTKARKLGKTRVDSQRLNYRAQQDRKQF